MAGRAKRTTNHEFIKRWVEERGGRPATVSSTRSDSEPGILRVDFPGYRGGESLQPISWDDFFRAFEENRLAFLYQETSNSDLSRFSKFVSRGGEEERAAGEEGAHGDGERAEGRRLRAGAAENGEQRPEERAPRQGGMRARDVMSPDPVVCTPGTPLKKVARLMEELDCGAIPVVDGLDTKLPVGVITDRDIALRAVARGKDPRELSAIDCMSSPVITVSPDDDVEDVIYILEQAQVRRAIVVDDRGVVVGVIAQADLVLTNPDLGIELVESVSLPRPQEAGMAEEGGPGQLA